MRALRPRKPRLARTAFEDRELGPYRQERREPLGLVRGQIQVANQVLYIRARPVNSIVAEREKNTLTDCSSRSTLVAGSTTAQVTSWDIMRPLSFEAAAPKLPSTMTSSSPRPSFRTA